MVIKLFNTKNENKIQDIIILIALGSTLLYGVVFRLPQGEIPYNNKN
jgi:hypothetical protein